MLTLDDVKNKQAGKWRIRKNAYDDLYFVERKRWIFWAIQSNGSNYITFESIDKAKAWIDAIVKDDFVRSIKRGESDFTIYYP